VTFYKQNPTFFVFIKVPASFMQIFFPSQALRLLVKRYVFVSTSDEVVCNTLLPDTSITLAFRLKGITSYIKGHDITPLPSIVITGLRAGPRVVKYETNSACIVVVFETLAGGNFFNGRAHEFFNNSIPLTDVINKNIISIVEERLQATTDVNHAIAIVEEFLLNNLFPAKPDELVREAVRLLTTTFGKINIRELASQLCISQDAFEKRFRKVVGSSPKHFARTIRLRAVVNQKQHPQPITSLALETGYFDSAHFNKDFKAFTGQSPSAFFKQPVFW